MPLRYYIAPVVGTGTSRADGFRSKIFDYINSGQVSLGAESAPAAQWFTVDPITSQPRRSWCLTALRASSFTVVDNDPAIDDLLGGSVPANIDSADAMVSMLQTTTIGTLPTARKNRVFAVLDKYSINRLDFTDANFLWDVLERVFRTLYGGTFDLTPIMSGFFI